MNEVLEYLTLEAHSPALIDAEVKLYMSEGHVPFGGQAVTYARGEWWYTHVVVKYGGHISELPSKSIPRSTKVGLLEYEEVVNGKTS